MLESLALYHKLESIATNFDFCSLLSKYSILLEEEIEEDDDEEIELLEKLLAQKRARKKNKDFEM